MCLSCAASGTRDFRRLRYGTMPREAGTGGHASGSDDPGLHVASHSVNQDPADTGADDAPEV